MLEQPDESRPPAVRISDAEKNAVVELLRSHCADGRLTLDEFADRVGKVFDARVHADLAVVTEDLPAIPEPVVGERRKSSSTVIGIMSGGVRKGRWRPGPKVNVFAFWGGCHIDLRGAEIDGPVIEIDAVAIMGGIEIVVPDGIKVEISGLPIMGGIDSSRIRDVPALPGTPVVRIKAFAFWGGVTVRSKARLDEDEREQRRLERDARRASRHGSDSYSRHHHDERRPSREEIERIERRHAALNHRPSEEDNASIDAVAAAVSEEKPDLSSDANLDGTVTILFSDIQDFTAMTERLGDLRAQEVLRAHNEIVRNHVASFGGREVKSQGDSFMVSFAGARRGVRCAIAIQQAFEQYCDKHPDDPLSVRIGLHTGEAIREADDLFGKSVIMAARIAGEAKGGEILVSSLLKELADSSGEFVFEEPRRVPLKGLTGEHALYPVEWRDGALPSIFGAP